MNIRVLLWISWIIIGLLGHLGDTMYRGKCQSEGYFEAVLNNARLRNYVISTHAVHSLEDCVMACLSDEHCSSYNFQVSGNPLHKCELNIKSRSSARPGSLVLEEGYQYYEIRDSKETEGSCETLGCKNGGVCADNCETLSFPHTKCQCNSSFTGEFCEIRKIGNFLLNYNSSTINDVISVSLTGNDFKHLGVCVWLKPSVNAGVVFSYATENNPKEMALLFNETNVLLHLGGQVISFNISLPMNKWSHICFTLYNKIKLNIYYNGLAPVRDILNITDKITVKGTGTLIPAFEQISPGKVNNSGSYLTVTRLYVLDKADLTAFEVLRLFNEPYFSVLATRTFRVNWREFYQPKLSSNSSALVCPSVEPDLGNYDLGFPGNSNVTINIPYLPPLEDFVLSMWIRFNISHDKDASLFEINSGNATVFKLSRKELKDFEFFFNFSDSTLTWHFPDIINDERWFHILFQWTKHKCKTVTYKHGSHTHSRHNNNLNCTMPEIYNATVRIGDSDFVGDITGLNLWSAEFTPSKIMTLALNPGNAAGDLLSWRSLKEQRHLATFKAIVPSSCRNRSDRFDLNFPAEPKQMNYIKMECSLTNNLNSISAAFWIKISSSSSEFTLISYAVPSQVNEFSVHFGTTGIWVYLHGYKRFIPLRRSVLLNKWHHFVISYLSRNGILSCYHNGRQIAKDKGLAKTIASKDGVLIVGAQQGVYKDMHQSDYQFIGELSQLQIYRRTFTQGVIRTFASRCTSVPGNLFRWADMPGGVRGQVRMRNQSECFKSKNGEFD